MTDLITEKLIKELLADVRRGISEATAKDKTLYPAHKGIER